MVDADLDYSGTIDSTDVTLAGSTRSGLSPGVLSSLTENAVGYDGYLFGGETSDYCVRNRWYDTTLGRWLERDPASVGANVYLAVDATPIGSLDPLGLRKVSWLRGPVALQVSWIDNMGAGDIAIGVRSVSQAYMRRFKLPPPPITISALVGGLAASANPAPPGGFNGRSFRIWDAAKEHRGWTQVQPTIRCCGGKVDRVRHARFKDDVGWTPWPLPRSMSRGDRGPGRRSGFRPSGGACQTLSILASGRLAMTENAMQAATTLQMAPYISRRIEYTICCDGTVTVSFAGSYFPSHEAYLGDWNTSVGSVGWRRQDASRLGEFMWSTGVITPTTFKIWTGKLATQLAGPDRP